MSELADIARQLIADNNYLALGTADPSGTPWVSPVYYTPAGYHDFYWVSAPDTRHSRNIAARPQVAITIYDSRVPLGTAEAVYLSATAARVPDDDLEPALAAYNSRLPEQRHFTLDDVTEPGLFRLYHARAVEHTVLIRGSDPRYGRGADSRMTVELPVS
jgi:uncharacterized protein YhbP (UPF0306 family)